MARRKYYVPITRSGSSILASLFTQAIDRQRALRKAKLQRQFDNGEINQWMFIYLQHPIFFAWAIFMIGGLSLVLISDKFFK